MTEVNLQTEEDGNKRSSRHYIRNTHKHKQATHTSTYTLAMQGCNVWEPPKLLQHPHTIAPLNFQNFHFCPLWPKVLHTALLAHTYT